MCESHDAGLVVLYHEVVAHPEDGVDVGGVGGLDQLFRGKSVGSAEQPLGDSMGEILFCYRLRVDVFAENVLVQRFEVGGEVLGPEILLDEGA